MMIRSRYYFALFWVFHELCRSVHSFGVPCSKVVVLTDTPIFPHNDARNPAKEDRLFHTSPGSSSPTSVNNISRKEVLFQLISTVLLWGGISTPQPAHAAYGESSNLELPNYIEFLIEKNAVADPDRFLYSGPDPKVQLQRLLDASKRLGDIPALAEDKKWSQVQGILSGPLGTLAQTLNFIAKDATPNVQAKAKQVKDDIFGINLAASKKNQAEVVSKTKAATTSLEAFVRAAF